jgi:16S rRNA (cytosine1402-N4)-methyltransferase
VRATFDDIDGALRQVGATRASAVLLDLGVSSMQLDTRARGFAYSYDAPLDMRMDPDAPLTAADVLADYSETELARILSQYGEERYARRIAKEIVATRGQRPLLTSGQLVALLERVIPARSQRTGGHPAKRTFQALRIEVNDELGCLRRALPAALASLVVGGRLVVMSFQSLEDRIVKRTFASVTQADVPPGLPVIPPDARPRFTLITRGAEVASAPEIEANPRAASVRLRAVERVEEAK